VPGVAFAGEYAAGRDWFVNDEPVPFEQREYLRSGGEVEPQLRQHPPGG
jgi:hypothetical protein